MSPLPDDFELLVASYLVADISDDEVQRLDGLLRENDSARATFAALAAEDIALRQALRVGVESGKPQSDSVQRILNPLPASSGKRVNEASVRASGHARSPHPPLFKGGRTAAAAFAACLLIGAATFYLSKVRAPRRLAHVATHSLGVSLHRDGTPDVAVGVDTDVKLGDTISTGADGEAQLSFEMEPTQFFLKKETTLRLLNGTVGKQFELLRGSIDCTVAKQPAGAPLRITTAQAIAEVVGTKFSLSADEELTHLDVNEGSVKIARRSDNLTGVAAANQQIVVGPLESMKPMPTEASLLAAGWKPLIGADLQGWKVMQGQWHIERGQLFGESHGRSRHDSALVRTTESWADFELTCQVRVDSGGYSEFQVRDDDWQFQNPAGQKVGIWRDIYIKALGPTVTCTLDGEAAELDEELSKKLNRSGCMGFYVTRSGSARFRNIYVRSILDPNAGRRPGQDF